jgi:hypothetical protein
MKNSNNHQVPINSDNSLLIKLTKAYEIHDLSLLTLLELLQLVQQRLIKRKLPFLSRRRQVIPNKVMSKVWENYPNGGSGLLTQLAFADWSDDKGLFTRPISIGQLAVGWPPNELIEINAPCIAGKSDEEIRALVVKLKTARKNAALGECHDNT